MEKYNSTELVKLIKEHIVQQTGTSPVYAESSAIDIVMTVDSMIDFAIKDIKQQNIK